MADESPPPATPPAKSVDRRGLDPGVLQFLHTLLAGHTEAHRREHELAAEAAQAAIDLVAARIVDMERAIREHYDTILTERDNRYGERFSASQEALRAAALAAKEAIDAALKATKEAVDKSETATLKTADTTFVKIDQLQAAMSKVVPREESDKTWGDVDRRLGDHDRRLTTQEAAKQGKVESRSETQLMVPWIAAAITLAAFVVAVIVAFGGQGGP